MYKQNFKGRKYDDPETDEYRNCLDALIATISDLDSTMMFHKDDGNDSGLYMSGLDREVAEERAAELAHIIMRKYINIHDPDSQEREQAETRANTGRKTSCTCEPDGPFMRQLLGAYCPVHGTV